MDWRRNRHRRNKRVQCPCCDRWFARKQTNTHHIHPKEWYHGSGETVRVCLECHKEFEVANPHNWVWSIQECECRWNTFIEFKHLKNPQVIPA
jgi:hypothetical protein